MLVQSLHEADSIGLEQHTENFHSKVVFVGRLVANANIAPHQSAQVIIHCALAPGMWNSFLCQTIRRYSVRSIRLFPVFYSTCDLIPDSASNEKCEDLVSNMFRQQAAKYSCVPSGGPWCVSFEVSRFMDTCHTPRSHSDAEFLQECTRRLNRLVNFCKWRTGFNKNS